MELEALDNIEKIASKLKISDKQQRLQTAKELNELSKLLIDWKNSENEKSTAIH